MTLQEGEFPLAPLLFWALPTPESEKNASCPQSRPTDSASGAGTSVSVSSLSGAACGAGSMGSAGVPLLLLLVGALPRIPGSEGGEEPHAHFLAQEKADCHFFNGTQRVRLLYSQFYDQQEFVRFDSDVGKFVAVTEFGQLLGWADYWNSGQEVRIKRAEVDSFCRHNYEAAKTGLVVGRRAKPTVTVSPTKMDPGSPNTILLCTATGFYPLEIDVQWLKNGRPEKEGVAFGEELQNGDWTYQLQVLLETQPQRGDVYACKVGHASLEAPVTVHWEPRSSNAAKSKLWTGAVGAVLGVVFLAVGLFLYLKNKKATPIQQPALMS
ncbi:rano class II histocompatibility antigen, A beta chain-like [Liasis olivaceus]